MTLNCSRTNVFFLGLVDRVSSKNVIENLLLEEVKTPA